MPEASNSSGAFTATISTRPVPEGFCVSQKVLDAISGQLQVSIRAEATQVTRSMTAPSDIRATWQPVNALGLPVGGPRQFDKKTSSWGKAVGVVLANGSVFAFSKDDGQLIKLGSDGLPYVGAGETFGRLDSSTNLLKVTEDGELYVDSAPLLEEFSKLISGSLEERSLAYNFIGPFGDGAPSNGFRLPGNPTLTEPPALDLNSVPGWKRTHQYALVWAKIVIGAGNGFSGGTPTSPAAKIWAGHDRNEVVSMIDADGQEGSNTNECLVRLNTLEESRHLFPYQYQVRVETSGIPWNTGKEQILAYIKAFL